MSESLGAFMSLRATKPSFMMS